MKIRILESTVQLVQGDITHQDVDAIVNAANASLAGGGGVDGAIHRAGGPSIMEETNARYPDGCKTGSAVISSAGDLPSKFVIHAVGPRWKGGIRREPELLKSAYSISLKLAMEHHCQSIAFPAISAGVYGYPIDLAATHALMSVAEFLREHETPGLVRFVLFDNGSYGAFANALENVADVTGDWV